MGLWHLSMSSGLTCASGLTRVAQEQLHTSCSGQTHKPLLKFLGNAKKAALGSSVVARVHVQHDLLCLSLGKGNPPEGAKEGPRSALGV